MNDEVLIHVTGWREMLRYATHARGDSWCPPLLTFETARMRDLSWQLTPLAFAVYHVLTAEYAAAPVLHALGGVKGSDGAPRRLPLRRALGALTSAGWNKSGRVPAAIDSLINAGLVVLATVDGRSVDGRVLSVITSREERDHEPERGHGLETIQGSNVKYLDPAETVPVDE